MKLSLSVFGAKITIFCQDIVFVKIMINFAIQNKISMPMN